MYKIVYLTMIAGTMLFGACNEQDEITNKADSIVLETIPHYEFDEVHRAEIMADNISAGHENLLYTKEEGMYSQALETLKKEGFSGYACSVDEHTGTPIIELDREYVNVVSVKTINWIRGI